MNQNSNDMVPMAELTRWVVNAVAADGVLTERERKLIANFAQTFGQDREKLISDAEDRAKDRLPEVINQGENYVKGYEFENYVVKDLCTQQAAHKFRFRLLRWSSDKSADGIFAEDERYPDLTLKFCHDNTEIEFFVECKFRGSWNKVPVLDKYQLIRYAKISRETKKIVIVVVGFGGKPDNPECISVATVSDFLFRSETIQPYAPKIGIQYLVFRILMREYYKNRRKK